MSERQRRREQSPDEHYPDRPRIRIADLSPDMLVHVDEPGADGYAFIKISREALVDIER